MRTVLILEAKEPEAACKLFADFSFLVLTVADVAKARFLLLNYSVDVWVCDLSTADLDFRTLRSETLSCNPQMKILLTGPALTQMHGNALVKEGLASHYISKPWHALKIKQLIQQLVSQAMEVVLPPMSTTDMLPFSATTQVNGKNILKVSRGIMSARGRGQSENPASSSNESRYRLDELLGEGGTGRVYRAFDMLLEMEVAVKLLNAELATDPEAVQALKNEARICMQLQHKHIVRFYNLDRRRNLFLIIMEYVRGCTLYQLMAQPDPIAPMTVLQIVSVLVDALRYAHKNGVLHKDLTPGNVMITDDGLLKVIDFSIADIMKRQNRQHDYVIGTPIYMSPEQLRGETLDERTDVYALGVLAYQSLTGNLPSYPNATVEDLAYREHPPLVGLPYNVLQVLELATAFDVENRWPSVAQFGDAFSNAFAQEYGLNLSH